MFRDEHVTLKQVALNLATDINLDKRKAQHA